MRAIQIVSMIALLAAGTFANANTDGGKKCDASKLNTSLDATSTAQALSQSCLVNGDNCKQVAEVKTGDGDPAATLEKPAGG
jgi:hypothetical protein